MYFSADLSGGAIQLVGLPPVLAKNRQRIICYVMRDSPFAIVGQEIHLKKGPFLHM